MKTHIVLISADDFTNGRDVAESILNHEFVDEQRVFDVLEKDLEFEDGGGMFNVLILTLQEFIQGCNDQSINLENWFIANITINK
jgi:hypothetical protein